MQDLKDMLSAETKFRVKTRLLAKGSFFNYTYNSLPTWVVGGGGTFSPRYGSSFWFHPLLTRIQLIVLSLNCLTLFSPVYSSFRKNQVLHMLIKNTITAWKGLQCQFQQTLFQGSSRSPSQCQRGCQRTLFSASLGQVR